MNMLAHSLQQVRSTVPAVREALSTILYVARRHRPEDGLHLLRAYLSLQAQELADAKSGAGHVALFGYDIEYFSIEAIKILVHEVFIQQPYYISLPDSPFIIDGGANIGLATVLFKHLHPNSNVLAFEPDPETYALLERNVRHNDLAGVTLVNAALGRFEGEADLYFDPDVPGNLGMSTEKVPSLKGKRRVPVKALSEFIDRRVDLLKLDIEGGEHAVVEDLAASGAGDLVDRIVMEYHHHMTSGDDRLGQLLGLLEDMNFGYQILSRPLVPFRENDFAAMFVYAYQKRLSKTVG